MGLLIDPRRFLGSLWAPDNEGHDRVSVSTKVGAYTHKKGRGRFDEQHHGSHVYSNNSQKVEKYWWHLCVGQPFWGWDTTFVEGVVGFGLNSA